MKNESNDKEESEILKRGNVVTRQELSSLTPKCDSNCAITFNLVLMVLFLIFGIPIIITGNEIVEFSQDYTNCKNDENGTCTMKITTNKTIPAPVYLYYGIDNFYMNHRDFVKSRSYPQLRGEVNVDLTKCEGAKYVSEIFDNVTSKYYTWMNVSLKGSDIANPCGLIAKSIFNDTNYKLYTSKGENIYINETNIANDYDKKYMFKRTADYKNLQWIDVENGKIKVITK